MSTYYSEDIYKGIPLLPGGYLLENLKTVFSAHFEVFLYQQPDHSGQRGLSFGNCQLLMRLFLCKV